MQIDSFHIWVIIACLPVAAQVEIPVKTYKTNHYQIMIALTD